MLKVPRCFFNLIFIFYIFLNLIPTFINTTLPYFNRILRSRKKPKNQEHYFALKLTNWTTTIKMSLIRLFFIRMKLQFSWITSFSSDQEMIHTNFCELHFHLYSYFNCSLSIWTCKLSTHFQIKIKSKYIYCPLLGMTSGFENILLMQC